MTSSSSSSSFLLLLLLLPLTAEAIKVEAVSSGSSGGGEEAGDSFRKVSDYFMVSEGARVRLRCEARRALPSSSSSSSPPSLLLAGSHVRRNFSWSFEPKEGDGKTFRLPADKTEAMLMSDPGPSAGAAVVEGEECHVNVALKDDQQGQAEVICRSSVVVNMFEGTVGKYVCRSFLRAERRQGRSAEGGNESEESVSLFLDARPAAVVVVTCIIVSTVAFVIVAGVCCRLAGHRFAWEYHEVVQGADGHYATVTRNSSVEDSSLWLTRAGTRYSSQASNISGLVFQSDPQGIRELLERLDHVEDPMSEGDEEAGVIEDAEEEEGADVHSGEEGGGGGELANETTDTSTEEKGEEEEREEEGGLDTDSRAFSLTIDETVRTKDKCRDDSVRREFLFDFQKDKPRQGSVGGGDEGSIGSNTFKVNNKPYFGRRNRAMSESVHRVSEEHRVSLIKKY